MEGNEKVSSARMLFGKLFYKQLLFQKGLKRKFGKFCKEQREFDDIPFDSTECFQYHCLALQEEVGELIKSDKRWKTFRNSTYTRNGKLEEIADCFIELLNIAMFSGFDCEELYEAIFAKISHNQDRVFGNNQ